MQRNLADITQPYWYFCLTSSTAATNEAVLSIGQHQPRKFTHCQLMKIEFDLIIR